MIMFYYVTLLSTYVSVTMSYIARLVVLNASHSKPNCVTSLGSDYPIGMYSIIHELARIVRSYDGDTFDQ